MNLNPELSEELRKRLCKLSIEIIINDKELNKLHTHLRSVCPIEYSKDQESIDSWADKMLDQFTDSLLNRLK